MPFEFLIPVALKTALWIHNDRVSERTPPPPPLLIQVGTSDSSYDWFGIGRRINQTLAGVRPNPLRDQPDETTASKNQLHNKNIQIQELLSEWESNFKPQKRGQVAVRKYVYDELFRRELRSLGVLAWDRDRVCCKLQPLVVDREVTKSHRKDRLGEPFQILPGHSMAVSLERSRLTVVDYDDDACVISYFPPGNGHLHSGFLDVMTPFRPIKAVEMSRAFKLELGKQNSAEQAHLVLKGTSREWVREFQSIDLLLRRPSYQPAAMRVIDVAGRQTVYVYGVPASASVVTDKAFQVDSGDCKHLAEFTVEP